MPTLTPDQQKSLNLQAELVKMLYRAPVPDALGAACSFLLHCAHNHPDVMRRVLMEPVVREGFRGTSLLTVLTRVSKE